ncbi:hypothetical protein AGMMS4952_08090 [Spirochaetia bacterium]|nr:hypothetical protein AGMMS4952_08090 [Spirochaetia bacterium]
MPDILEEPIVLPDTAAITDSDAEYEHDRYIQEKLAEAEAYAARADAKWYTWDEVRNFITVKHGI